MTSSTSWPPVGERVLLYASALLISVLAGAFVAQVEFIWVIGVICVLAAVAMISSREATLWFVIITGFIVVGVTQIYLPGAKYFKYLPPLAAAGLLLHVASERLQHPRRRVPATVQVFLAFVAISLVSMAANWQEFGMAVIGLKSYYPMWALFFGLAMIQWRPGVIDSLPKAALLLALLQLPFVVHEFLYLVPLRQGIPGVTAVDIVAGTFGGDLVGGGANAVLTLFLVMVVACLLGLWRHGALSGPVVVLSVGVLLTPVLLNSSRAALLYLPIVFGIVFAADIVRRPLRTFAGFLVVGAVLLGMLMSYTVLSQAPGTRTWQDLLRTTYEGQLATEGERSDNYSGFTRWTVLTFWAEKHTRRNLVEVLIGHGPGATRVQEEGIDLAKTLTERRFGSRQIGYTAVAALLWEVGVIGLVIVLALFWAGYSQARQLVRHYADTDPTKAGIAHGLSAFIVILTLSLAHKDFFAFHIPYQTMVACVFGYLAAQMQLAEGAPWLMGERHERGVAVLPAHE